MSPSRTKAVTTGLLSASVVAAGLALAPAAQATITPPAPNSIYEIGKLGQHRCEGSSAVVRGHLSAFVGWDELGQSRVLQVKYKLPKKKVRVRNGTNVMFYVKLPKKLKPGMAKFWVRQAATNEDDVRISEYGPWTKKTKVRITKKMVNKIPTYGPDTNACGGY